MMPILFLAPYRSMADMASSIANEMGISLAVEVTNDQMAKSVVYKHPSAEVIISRGGMAEEIKSIEGITVIEVTMSVNDLLNILNAITRKGIKRIGLVSRANVFDCTAGDFQIFQTEIYIRSCKDEDEIASTVLQLHQEGVEAVIGCRVAYETAKSCGIVAEFLDSSAVSIRKAIEDAVRIVRAKEQEKLQAAQLAAIIDNIEEGIIAVTGDKQVSFCNNLA